METHIPLETVTHVTYMSIFSSELTIISYTLSLKKNFIILQCLKNSIKYLKYNITPTRHIQPIKIVFGVFL